MRDPDAGHLLVAELPQGKEAGVADNDDTVGIDEDRTDKSIRFYRPCDLRNVLLSAASGTGAADRDVVKSRYSIRARLVRSLRGYIAGCFARPVWPVGFRFAVFVLAAADTEFDGAGFPASSTCEGCVLCGRGVPQPSLWSLVMIIFLVIMLRQRAAVCFPERRVSRRPGLLKFLRLVWGCRCQASQSCRLADDLSLVTAVHVGGHAPTRPCGSMQ